MYLEIKYNMFYSYRKVLKTVYNIARLFLYALLMLQYLFTIYKLAISKFEIKLVFVLPIFNTFFEFGKIDMNMELGTFFYYYLK